MKKHLWVIGALTAVLFAGCQEDPEDDDHNNGDHDHAIVNLSIEHVVGSMHLMMDTMMYTSAAGHTYDIQKLRYFITDVTFTDDEGNTAGGDNEFYVDAEDASTTAIETGIELEDGHWHMMSFTFGIDTLKNASDLFTEEPEVNMSWPETMGGGFHYMKLEGAYTNDSMATETNFKAHTGPTMGNDYSFEVSAMIHQDVEDAGDITVTITMDIDKWLSSPNTYDFDDYLDGTMMNMGAQMVLQENGADVFTISSAETSDGHSHMH